LVELKTLFVHGNHAGCGRLEVRIVAEQQFSHGSAA
jgi:hypothetical protein